MPFRHAAILLLLLPAAPSASPFATLLYRPTCRAYILPAHSGLPQPACSSPRQLCFLGPLPSPSPPAPSCSSLSRVRATWAGPWSLLTTSPTSQPPSHPISSGALKAVPCDLHESHSQGPGPVVPTSLRCCPIPQPHQDSTMCPNHSSLGPQCSSVVAEMFTLRCNSARKPLLLLLEIPFSLPYPRFQASGDSRFQASGDSQRAQHP